MKELSEKWEDYTEWLEEQIARGMRDVNDAQNYTFGDFMNYLISPR